MSIFTTNTNTTALHNVSQLGVTNSGMLGPQQAALNYGSPTMQSRFGVNIYRARNGHVISVTTHPGVEPDLWLVPEEGSIVDTIAAAMAAHVMEKL